MKRQLYSENVTVQTAPILGHISYTESTNISYIYPEGDFIWGISNGRVLSAAVVNIA